jgi:hypothetical protein
MRRMMRLLRKVDGTGIAGVTSVEVRSHIERGIRGLIASKTRSVDVEAMIAVVAWERTGF